MQRRFRIGLHVVGGAFSLVLLYASFCQQAVESRQQQASKNAVAAYAQEHPAYRTFLYDVLPARQRAPGHVPTNGDAHGSVFRDSSLMKTPCERAVAAQAAWREDAAARTVPANGWARLLMPIPTPALKRPGAVPAQCDSELGALKKPH